MEKYGVRIFYPYNITDHVHYEGDGHHYEGDGHEIEAMKAIEARKRFLLVTTYKNCSMRWILIVLPIRNTSKYSTLHRSDWAA